MRNRTRIRRKICRSRANDRAAVRWTPLPFGTPSFQLPKNRSFQAIGPWGHSLYVLSVTCRMQKYKMVLSKCCQNCHSQVWKGVPLGRVTVCNVHLDFQNETALRETIVSVVPTGT